MIHFIRSKKNKTIVDVEVFLDEFGHVDLSSTVLIKPYSIFLLNNLDRKDEIILDFQEMSEFKGWLWETFKTGNHERHISKNEVSKLIRNKMKKISNKYKDLIYVED